MPRYCHTSFCERSYQPLVLPMPPIRLAVTTGNTGIALPDTADGANPSVSGIESEFGEVRLVWLSPNEK